MDLCIVEINARISVIFVTSCRDSTKQLSSTSNTLKLIEGEMPEQLCHEVKLAGTLRREVNIRLLVNVLL
jgi:hypothetical protein